MTGHFHAPNRKPAVLRQSHPRERLFEFLRGHDRFLCELRDDGPHGVTAQFLEYEDSYYLNNSTNRSMLNSYWRRVPDSSFARARSSPCS
jgi:hypothetical protein